jgi:succinate dehydrogenase / fumarate reductase cytochrome b subunit
MERPLSPHWTVYRWQVTNTLSILHRLTGLYLSLGIAFAVWWLVTLASGPIAYEAGLDGVFGSLWFRVLSIGWIACFFYHFANGVRHLFWDVGLGFDRTQIRSSGWAVVLVAAAATVIYSVLAFT